MFAAQPTQMSSVVLIVQAFHAQKKHCNQGKKLEVRIRLLQPESSPEVTGSTQNNNHPQQIEPLPPLPVFPEDLPDPLPFAPSEDLPFPCQVATKVKPYPSKETS